MLSFKFLVRILIPLTIIIFQYFFFYFSTAWSTAEFITGLLTGHVTDLAVIRVTQHIMNLERIIQDQSVSSSTHSSQLSHSTLISSYYYVNFRRKSDSAKRKLCTIIIFITYLSYIFMPIIPKKNCKFFKSNNQYLLILIGLPH